MRRIPEERQAVITRVGNRRHRQDVRRARNRHDKAVQHQARLERHRALAATHHLQPPTLEREPIILPKVLSFRTNYKETMSAITALRESALVATRPAMIYFDHVEELEPAAILTLTAEIHRCKQLRSYTRRKIINGNYPNDRNVFLQLRDMGFYRLIEVNERESVPDGREKEGRPFFIPFRTFKGVDPQFAAEFCQLTARSAFNMSQLALGRMVGALKEAMGNAYEHAYQGTTRYPFMSGRWWVTGYVDPGTHEMMISFFDQGVGIPNRLSPDMFDFVRSSLAARSWGLTDGYMIAAATELHRTSTGLSGRGKGFRDMKKFVDTCDDGELRVLSNRGAYHYIRDKDTIDDHPLSVGGTLIEWRVRHGTTVEVE